MITRLTIRAFKSILEADLELGQVNVFVGANGSGKSNLLEAPGVIGACANGRVDDESLLRRGVRPGPSNLFKSSFRNDRSRNAIRLGADGEGAEYSVELLPPPPDKEQAWQFKTESLAQGAERIVGRSPASTEALDPQRGLAALRAVELAPESPASLFLRELLDYAIYTPTTSVLRGLVQETQPRDPVGLSGGRLAEAVQQLDQLLPDGHDTVEEIFGLIEWADAYRTMEAGQGVPISPSVPTARKVLCFEDRYMAEGRNLLTSYDASEGALYVLFVAALANLPNAPRIFAIDNFDHGLNPRLARALTEHFCRWILNAPKKRQVLLTSHNPLVLDGLPLEDDRVRLFTVGRTQRGLTNVRRIRLGLDELQRNGEVWTVSRLWVNGHLGGVPDV